MTSPESPKRPSLQPSRLSLVVGVVLAVGVGAGFLLFGQSPSGDPVARPDMDSVAAQPGRPDNFGADQATLGEPSEDGNPADQVFLVPRRTEVNFGSEDLVSLPYVRGGTVDVPVAALEAATAQLSVFVPDAAITDYIVEFAGSERLGLNITWSGDRADEGLFVMVKGPSGLWETANGHLDIRPFG